MAKSFDKLYMFCRFFILLYSYSPPQTLQLLVWVCEEFLSSALHQSAPVNVRNASVENEKSFLFWADGWHLLSSNRPLLELGELWLWLALISRGCPPTGHLGEDMIGWRWPQGSRLSRSGRYCSLEVPHPCVANAALLEPTEDRLDQK